jgi:hypothetical protein
MRASRRKNEDLQVLQPIDRLRSVYVNLEGKGRWLSHNLTPHVIESASILETASTELGDHLTRDFELGKADQYYSSICRGINDGVLIKTYIRLRNRQGSITKLL